jgi:hypothetical protein
LHGDLRGSIVDLAEIVAGKLDCDCSDVFFQAMRFVVPGIGTIQGFWASSQAIAICAGVACFRSATLLSKSTKAWFASRPRA